MGTQRQDDSEPGTFAEPQGDLSVRVGRKQIDIQNRWEAALITNDFLTGLSFLVGTLLNLAGGFGDWPMYLYLLGSAQLMLRAALSLGHRIHVRRGYSRTRPRVYKPGADS